MSKPQAVSVFVILEPETTPTCSAIYTKFDESEVCSYILPEKLDWQAAEAACAELGARLPAIDDLSDNQLILDLKVGLKNVFLTFSPFMRYNTVGYVTYWPYKKLQQQVLYAQCLIDTR